MALNGTSLLCNYFELPVCKRGKSYFRHFVKGFKMPLINFNLVICFSLNDNKVFSIYVTLCTETEGNGFLIPFHSRDRFSSVFLFLFFSSYAAWPFEGIFFSFVRLIDFPFSYFYFRICLYDNIMSLRRTNQVLFEWKEIHNIEAKNFLIVKKKKTFNLDEK